MTHQLLSPGAHAHTPAPQSPIMKSTLRVNSDCQKLNRLASDDHQAGHVFARFNQQRLNSMGWLYSTNANATTTTFHSNSLLDMKLAAIITISLLAFYAHATPVPQGFGDVLGPIAEAVEQALLGLTPCPHTNNKGQKIVAASATSEALEQRVKDNYPEGTAFSCR